MAGFALPNPLALRPRLPRPGRARIALLLAPVALALLLGGWLWFRDSSFASVESVQISGLAGPGAAEIETALRRAAREMSTLDVNVGALKVAVASYPQVHALRVSASFPHSLRIAVIEQPAVAVLQAASGRRAAAAADGVLLGGTLAASDLPTIPVTSLPAKRVNDPLLLDYLQVLGATPAPLARLVWRVYEGPKGVTVALRDGMLVVFGDSARARAKWLSFASVLVANGSPSAAYVDVRVPERAAIASTTAGPAGATGGTGGAGAAAAQGSLGTSSAIAASLQAAIGGEASAQSATQAPPGSAQAQSEAAHEPQQATQPPGAGTGAQGGAQNGVEVGASGSAEGGGGAAPTGAAGR